MQVFWNLSGGKKLFQLVVGQTIFTSLFLYTLNPSIFWRLLYLILMVFCSPLFIHTLLVIFLHFFEFAFFWLNLKECPRWAHVWPAIFRKVFRDVDPFFPYASLHAMVTNNNNVGLVSDAMTLQLLYEFTQKFVNFFHLIIHLPKDKKCLQWVLY